MLEVFNTINHPFAKYLSVSTSAGSGLIIGGVIGYGCHAFVEKIYDFTKCQLSKPAPGDLRTVSVYNERDIGIGEHVAVIQLIDCNSRLDRLIIGGVSAVLAFAVTLAVSSIFVTLLPQVYSLSTLSIAFLKLAAKAALISSVAVPVFYEFVRGELLRNNFNFDLRAILVRKATAEDTYKRLEEQHAQALVYPASILNFLKAGFSPSLYNEYHKYLD